MLAGIWRKKQNDNARTKTIIFSARRDKNFYCSLIAFYNKNRFTSYLVFEQSSKIPLVQQTAVFRSGATTGGDQPNVRLVGLGRNAGIDTFVEGTTGRVDSKFAFVLLEQCNVIRGNAWNLVDILHRSKGSVASNLSGSMWEHTT